MTIGKPTAKKYLLINSTKTQTMNGRFNISTLKIRLDFMIKPVGYLGRGLAVSGQKAPTKLQQSADEAASGLAILQL